MTRAKTEAQREFRRAEKLVERAVLQLCDASRILAGQGHQQASRSLDSASFEAATALGMAISDADTSERQPSPREASNDSI